MREREVSVSGMAAATLVCLVATALTMADVQRYSKVALVLFSFAWLIFYVSVAMPFKLKRRARIK
jgi:hypothetical protein